MWMLNPALRRVGYGQYCEAGICAAALDIRSGIEASASQTARPIMFPSDRALIRNATFGAEESEWPDPLASCGYTAPSGIPITLQTGGNHHAALEEFSISQNGAAAESCGFDASSYKSTDPVAWERVQKQLAHFGAVVVVPKKPLAPGSYAVSIKVSGETYAWRFSVQP